MLQIFTRRSLAALRRHALGPLAAALLTIVAPPAFAQTVNYDLATTSVMRINLPVSQAVTVTLSSPAARIVAADSLIADAQPITDRSIFLVGKSFGTTTVNLYNTEGRPIGLLSVTVGADTDDIARSIRAAIPNSSVKVSSVNGRIRLSGNVPDALSREKALLVAAQYLTPLDTASGPPPIIDTMTIVGGQQVNLEVRILEANRGAGRELGFNWGVNGTQIIGDGPGSPTDNAQSFSQFITSILGIGGMDIRVAITALEQKNLVRTLAEPNLTTLSGVQASFLAGGQLPLRVNEGDGKYSITYKDFGVRLVFTPVVLEGDRIQIKLTPEVSSIGGFTEAGDPVFNTRNLDATVELRDGQSFSVAGLLQNDTRLKQNQLPWVGDVPIIGSLFKSSSYQKNESELVVIVTPRLVRPNAPNQPLATPLDQTLPANDVEFFALGQLEVTPKMIQNFERGAGIVGPYGYIIDLGGDT